MPKNNLEARIAEWEKQQAGKPPKSKMHKPGSQKK